MMRCISCCREIRDDYWDICGDLLCEECARRIYRRQCNGQ